MEDLVNQEVGSVVFMEGWVRAVRTDIMQIFTPAITAAATIAK